MWWHNIPFAFQTLGRRASGFGVLMYLSTLRPPHRSHSYHCLKCVRYISLTLLAAVLVACGFTPVYSKHAARNPVAVEAALETQVEGIPGRNGQLLRTTLLDTLNPASIPAAPRYRLTVTLKETEVPVGIQQDRRITRYNIIQEAYYTLRHIKTREVIDKGRVRVVGSYDAVDSDFATFAARQDTVERVLKEMGRDITNRVMAAFLKHNKKPSLRGALAPKQSRATK